MTTPLPCDAEVHVGVDGRMYAHTCKDGMPNPATALVIDLFLFLFFCFSVLCVRERVSFRFASFRFVLFCFVLFVLFCFVLFCVCAGTVWTSLDFFRQNHPGAFVLVCG